MKLSTKGIECILKCQIVVDGTKTVWCAQHDGETLAPAKARSYELPSLSGGESVRIVQFLMQIENPDRRIVEAVEAAIAWYEDAALHGIRLVRKEAPSAPEGFDRFVIEDPEAPPMWARFYQIGTNQPIFCSRDGIPRQRLADISHERRNGYSWLGYYGQDLLAEDYPAWQVWIAGEKHEPETEAVDESRHLVLDSRKIASTSNVKLVLGKIEKHPANPLFGEDKPWEQRFDNFYGSIVYDEDKKLYRLWWNPFIYDPDEGADERENGLEYAVFVRRHPMDEAEPGACGIRRQHEEQSHQPRFRARARRLQGSSRIGSGEALQDDREERRRLGRLLRRWPALVGLDTGIQGESRYAQQRHLGPHAEQVRRHFSRVRRGGKDTPSGSGAIRIRRFPVGLERR